MDRDTFSGTIGAFKHRIPFRPFTVAMVNGDRFEVDHPDALGSAHQQVSEDLSSDVRVQSGRF